jgi:hypothetical protein
MGHERPISDVRPMSAFLGSGSIAKPREVTGRANSGLMHRSKQPLYSIT